MTTEIPAFAAGVIVSPVCVLELPQRNDGRLKIPQRMFPDSYLVPDLVLGSIASGVPTSTDDDTSVSLSSISEASASSKVEDGENPQPRRSIFTKYWKNTGQLPIDLKPTVCDSIRSLPLASTSRASSYLVGDEKAQSDPVLVHPKPVSILRKTPSSSRRRSERSNVSFDSKVDVVLFQPPPIPSKEGWSKQFTG